MFNFCAVVGLAGSLLTLFLDKVLYKVTDVVSPSKLPSTFAQQDNATYLGSVGSHISACLRWPSSPGIPLKNK